MKFFVAFLAIERLIYVAISRFGTDEGGGDTEATLEVEEVTEEGIQ